MKSIGQIRYYTSLSIPMFVTLIVFMISACTGTPKTEPMEHNEAVGSEESADPLGQLLQQAQSDQKKVERSDPRFPQGIIAVSTFALFASKALLPHYENDQQTFNQQIKKSDEFFKT